MKLFQVGIYISYVHTQLIYECNFDTSTTNDNCFTTTITVGASAGIAGTLPPTGPQSDVTASCKKSRHFIIFYINIIYFFLCSEANN